MTASIYLVRHGETVWNQEGRYQGSIDTDRAARGRAQADALGTWMKDMPITWAFASPLKRAWETAERVLAPRAQAPRLVPEASFREIGHGSWEGRFAVDIAREEPDLLKAWREQPASVTFPGGESLQDVADRVMPAFGALEEGLKDEEHILIVCHDAILKVILCAMHGRPLDDFWKFQQDPTAFNLLIRDAPGKALRPALLNGQEHLPPGLAATPQKAL